MTALALVSEPVARALTFPERARAIVLRDDSSYAAAAEFLKGIKALRAEITETFSPHIKRAHEAHKALLREQQEAEAPLLEAEQITKLVMVTYSQEQDKLRRLEQQRIEAELHRQAVEAKLADAVALEAVGASADADAVLDEPVAPIAVPVAASTPAVRGIALRETWSAQVTDLLTLVQFVAANPQYLNLLTPSMPALNAQARSLKAQMRIGGVQAVVTRDIAAGRG